MPNSTEIWFCFNFLLHFGFGSVASTQLMPIINNQNSLRVRARQRQRPRGPWDFNRIRRRHTDQPKWNNLKANNNNFGFSSSRSPSRLIHAPTDSFAKESTVNARASTFSSRVRTRDQHSYLFVKWIIYFYLSLASLSPSMIFLSVASMAFPCSCLAIQLSSPRLF